MYNNSINFSFLLPILIAVGLMVYMYFDQEEENRNRERLTKLAKMSANAFLNIFSSNPGQPSPLQSFPQKKPSKLNINTASAEEIAQLPGFNIVLAKKLVEQRTKGKHFNNIDEIVDLFDIKPHIRQQLLEYMEFRQEASEHKQHTGNNDFSRGRVVDF